MKKTILTFAALILIAAPALADMETDLGLAIDVTGDAVPAGSYAKHISITTAQDFDLIAVMPADGSSVRLSNPYLSGFKPTSWTLVTGSPTLAAALGTALPSGTRYTASFNVELLPFGDPATSPHLGDAFIVAVWAEPADKPAAEWGYEYDYQCKRIGFSPVGWQVEDLGEPTNLSRYQILTVPAPAAIGLGILGLGLVGWYMRRFA